MKFGTLVHPDKTHKKVSWSHNLSPTGSRPFLIKAPILRRLHQMYLNNLVWGILSHQLQFHSVSSQDLEEEKLWKYFWSVFSFGRGSTENFAIYIKHIWTNYSSGFGLSFSKFHMFLQHRRVNTCYDFHKWAWLNACVAPPRKFQKLSPALQIVRQKWNSVDLYIIPRCTKKSLGAMT